jgi:hypothetical protein
MPEKRGEEVGPEVERWLRQIEALEEEARRDGLAFASLTEEELVSKLTGEPEGEGAHSPFFVTFSWTSGAAAGWPAAVFIPTVANPDWADYMQLFVTLFFGATSFVADVGQALAARDTRMPYMSKESLLAYGPGTSVQPQLFYAIPSSIPKGDYWGNAVLWQGRYFGKGLLFDRAGFRLRVT